MKTLPNAKQAEAYVNELTGIASLVNDFNSTSGPGNITFTIHPKAWPWFPHMFTSVKDQISARLGDPQTRVAFHACTWQLDALRTIRLWKLPSPSTRMFIGLNDEGEI